MRVLVTGASGLVGSRLVPALEGAGHRVHGCDLDVDVASAAAFAPVVSSFAPEAIAHLAAISATRDPDEDPSAVFRINYGGAAVLFETTARLAPGARVLFVSTGLIYGSLAPRARSFDEQAALRPRGAYGWSKATGDRLGQAWAERGLDVVRARPFNHTAAGRRDDFVESRLARQLAAIELGQQEPVVHALNVRAVRDFLTVDDVVAAYQALLDPAVEPGAYNIASGRGVSILEIWQKLLAHASVEPELVWREEDQDETDRSVGDATRLKDVTGWSPRGDLDATLGSILDFWREHLGSA